MHNSATDAIVGRRLRVFRVSKGYELDALAAALNLDVSTVERYENGMERIPPLMLRDAAAVLNISLHAFFDPHNMKVVHVPAAAEVSHQAEPAGDISQVVELLEHFAKVKDRDLRSEILRFVAFLSHYS